MRTITLTQQQLDKIVDDIHGSDVEWEDYHKCSSYTIHNFDGVNLAICANFYGHPEENSIDFEGHTYYDTPSCYVDGFIDAELYEVWCDPEVEDVDVDLDLDYISESLKKLDY